MPNSDKVISTLLSEAPNGSVGVLPGTGTGGFLTGSFASPGANDGGQVPLYFGTSTDPVYKVINLKHGQCGPIFQPLEVLNSSGYINNLTFHAPTGAQFSGQGGGDDNSIAVWDVSGSGISNGKLLGFYTCCGGATALPACPGIGADGLNHAGTQSDPCAMNAEGGGPYCNYADPNGTGFASGSAVDGSNGTGPYSAWTRNVEIEAGHIYHAANSSTSCEATAGGAEPNVVFPAVNYGQTGYGALKCTNQSALGPPNGSLYFLDYTDTQLGCLNPSQPTCTGADGKVVNKLDPIHYVFIEQLAHYGSYESDTGGPASTPGGWAYYHVESSQSYSYYSTHGYPTALTGICPFCYGVFQNLMNSHCSGSYTDPTNWCYTNNRSSPNSTNAWEMRIFYNLPVNLPGPTCTTAQAAAGNCGVGKHLHMADPCVAVGMAGLTSAGQWNACPGP